MTLAMYNSIDRRLETRLDDRRHGTYIGGKFMLWTIILVLLVLWALGFGFAGAAVGSLIHLLLVLAVIVLVIQLVTGKRGAI